MCKTGDSKERCDEYVFNLLVQHWQTKKITLRRNTHISLSFIICGLKFDIVKVTSASKLPQISMYSNANKKSIP